MKQLIRIFAGVLTAMLPVTGAAMFSFLIYNELQSVAGFIIAAVLLLGAIWFGVIVFRAIYRQGFLKFMTPVFSTPDLDKLEPADKVEK
ncbi:hypothetical protein [Mangrovibacterium lignilyticum]|uniref:hypothetical protein n=1 Tax=Mangrovibacterium lignilyticum TaxID=2668052 RepID=UPI0013CFB5D2|nr:hypothetical protein [Mangrovibacterium lignilyticum]